MSDQRSAAYWAAYNAALAENVELQFEARAIDWRIRHSRDGSVPELWERLRVVGDRITELHDKFWK
jgi:hypothetical protein